MKLNFDKIQQYGFWIYIIGILLLVTLPLNKALDRVEDITVLKVRGDYLSHFLLFMPWAFFGWYRRRMVWRWLLTGMAFATITEFLQFVTPWRRFNINDLVANNIGVILGVLLFILIERLVVRYNLEPAWLHRPVKNL